MYQKIKNQSGMKSLMSRVHLFSVIFALVITVFSSCRQDEVKVISVTLNKNTLLLNVNDVEQLTAAVTPDNATDKSVTWSSSAPAVATVDHNGNVKALSSGTAVITVTTHDGGKTAKCMVTVSNGTTPPNPPSAGVVINGVTWATCNVDAPGTFAARPESTGMFYQWNRKIGWSNSNPLVGSNGSSTWDSSVPSGTEWEKANDPSPSGWRVPTTAEIESLQNVGKVSNEWTTQNGVTGCKFTDLSTGNSIFMPAVGYRYFSDGSLVNVGTGGKYWSSTPFGSGYAYCLLFSSGGVGQGGDNRRNGLSVRCVAE